MQPETKKKKSRALHLIWLVPVVLFVLLIVAIGLNSFTFFTPYLPRFGCGTACQSPEICNTPGYDKIQNGMTQEEVKAILGTPDNLLSKEESENGYPSQDSSVPKDYKEVWIYFGKPGANIGGSISIMISDDGKVIQKTCGGG